MDVATICLLSTPASIAAASCCCRLPRVGVEVSCRLASFIECWAAGRRASICGFAGRRGHTKPEVLASSWLVATPLPFKFHNVGDVLM